MRFLSLELPTYKLLGAEVIFKSGGCLEPQESRITNRPRGQGLCAFDAAFGIDQGSGWTFNAFHRRVRIEA
jgi:hypothetical protein